MNAAIDASIRILIGENDGATRAELREAVESRSGFVVVAEASDAPGAVQAALRTRPDLCLLDVEMAGNGISAAWEICGRLPETRVVMLADSYEERRIFAALNAGAVGYLVKGMDPMRLADALADACSGGTAIPRWMVTRLVEQFRDRSARRRSALPEINGARLTSREWQVLELLRQRRSTREIARQLTLSPPTVRCHVASIVRKLGVGDREALIETFDHDGGSSGELVPTT
jgi:DNA-binding NarL/FixJ family response regulator